MIKIFKMKKILIVILFCTSVSAFAQNIIMVDTTVVMSKGLQPAIQINIPQISQKTLKHDWLKYIGKLSKDRCSETESENLLTNVSNSNISPGSFKVYSTLLETTAGTKLTVWLTTDDITFYSRETNVDQHLAIQKYLYDFSFTEYQMVVADELKSETNRSAELEKELSALIKDHERSLKIISEDEGSIQKANDDILVNNSDLKNISAKILVQKTLVDKTASDENANKGARKTLKDLENEKENIEALKETNNKHIISWNKEIREKERNIEDLIVKQSLKGTEINLQRDKVQTVQFKLDNLK
jgi:hypothetical protein